MINNLKIIRNLDGAGVDIEIGMPFSDPVALDQSSSEAAKSL